ncbi:MAG: hypothetical protein ACFFD4_11210 [Candidatus Odinarchaeota archaeon]
MEKKVLKSVCRYNYFLIAGIIILSCMTFSTDIFLPDRKNVTPEKTGEGMLAISDSVSSNSGMLVIDPANDANRREPYDQATSTPSSRKKAGIVESIIEVDTKYVTSPDTFVSSTDIAVDSYGNIFIVFDYYAASLSKYCIEVQFSNDKGNTWHSYGKQFYDFWVGNPDIEVDLSDSREIYWYGEDGFEEITVNEAYVVYEYEYSTTDHDIYLWRLYSNRITAVDADSGDEGEPVLAIKNERIFVAYENWKHEDTGDTGKGTDIIIAKSVNAGESFFTWREIGTGRFQDSDRMNPAIAIDASNNFYIVYIKRMIISYYRSVHIEWGHYDTAGNFPNEKKLYDPNGYGTYDITIAVSRHSGTATYIAVGILTDGGKDFIQFYSTNGGSTWSDDKIIASYGSAYGFHEFSGTLSSCRIVADGMSTGQNVLNNFWYFFVADGKLCCNRVPYYGLYETEGSVDLDKVEVANAGTSPLGFTTHYVDGEGWVPAFSYTLNNVDYTESVYYASKIPYIPGPPPAPVLYSPIDAEYLNDPSPLFDWEELPNIVEYRIVVKRSDLADPVIDTTTVSSYFEPATPLPERDYLFNFYKWWVKAKNIDGYWSDWSKEGNFLLDTVPPPAPTPYSPSDVILSYNNDIQFNWSYVDVVKYYQLNVWDDTSTLQINTTVERYNSYHTSTPLADGVYYWRVRAKDRAGNWGDWSPNLKYFRIDTGHSFGPSLVWPCDGEIIANTQPVLDWAAIRGAIDYWVEIDDDPVMGTPLNIETNAVFSEHYFDPLPDGTYYWRVRGRYGGSDYSPWSEVWLFTIDQSLQFSGISSPISPAHTSTINDTTPYFAWTSVTGATTYQLCVDDTYPFSSSPIIDVTTANTYHDATTLLTDGKYYWGVRAKNDTSTWGNRFIVHFFIDSCPPDPPVMLSPVEETIYYDNFIEFNWSSVDDVVYYKFEIADDPAFTSIIYGEFTGDNYTSRVISSSGQYYCRVRGRDDANSWGQYSPVVRFDIDLSIPPPLYDEPINNSFVHTDIICLRWLSINKSKSFYHVQVSPDSDFSSLIVNETTSDLFYLVTLPDGSYYWRLRASAETLPYGKWGETWFFKLNASVTPLLLAPGDGYNVDEPVLQFLWSEVEGAISYELQISTVPDFLTTESNITVYGTLIITRPLDDGDYYWRVRARYAKVDYSPWSSTRTFTIDVNGGTGTQLVYPSNGELICDYQPLLDWVSSKGATNFQVQLATTSDFVKKVLDEITNNSFYKISTTIGDANYFWRVRTNYDDRIWSPWSNTWSFTLEGFFAEIPQLLAPGLAANISDITPTFEWEALPYKNMAYHIQLSTSSEFDTLTLNTTTTASEYTVSDSLVDGIYYWRVRAKDSTRDWGYWSEIRYFNLTGAFSGIPPLVSPLDGAEIKTNVPSLEWGALKGATLYQVQVSTVIDFIKTVIVDETVTNSYSITTPLTDGTYYWRVRAKDRPSDWGDWSEVWSFTVKTVSTSETTTLTRPTGTRPTDTTSTTRSTAGWTFFLSFSGLGVLLIVRMRKRKVMIKGD